MIRLTWKVAPIVSRYDVFANVGLLHATNDALVLLNGLIVLADVANCAPFRLKLQSNRVGWMVGYDFRQALEDIPFGLFTIASAQKLPVRCLHLTVVVQWGRSGSHRAFDVQVVTEKRFEQLS